MDEAIDLDLKIAKLKNLDIEPREGHVWKLDEDGEIDMHGVDTDDHAGPYCVRCNYTYCQWCYPNGKGIDNNCEPHIPAYTKVVHLAMELYEEMEAAGIVTLSNGDGDSVDFNFIPYSISIGPIAISRPMGTLKSTVICLAWLKWKGAVCDS